MEKTYPVRIRQQMRHLGSMQGAYRMESWRCIEKKSLWWNKEVQEGVKLRRKLSKTETQQNQLKKRKL